MNDTGLILTLLIWRLSSEDYMYTGLPRVTSLLCKYDLHHSEACQQWSPTPYAGYQDIKESCI